MNIPQWVCALAAAVLLAACSDPTEAPDDLGQFTAPFVPAVDAPVEPEEQPEPAPAAAVAPLTGVPYEHAAWGDRPALAVKVANDPGARPQTGLEQADIVFEELTEYGITRFAAVFHSQLPDTVGNVRSARFVDVDLLGWLEPVLAYSGARDAVRADLAQAPLQAVTEGAPGFVRDGARKAPHNLYIRPGDLLEAAGQQPAVRPVPWRFGDLPSGGRPVEGRATVPMSSSYVTGWEYDPEHEVWRRYQDGTYHAVTGPDAIGAANVVILQVPTAGVDDKGGVVYRLEGEGEALLLRDGVALRIGWAKAGRGEELLLTGEGAVLRPGPTWILLGTDQVLAKVAGAG